MARTNRMWIVGLMVISVWGLPRSFASADSETDGLALDVDGAGTLEVPQGPRRPGIALDRKIRRLKWGVGTSAVAVSVGFGMFVGGAALDLTTDRGKGPGALFVSGIVFMIGGTAGLIATAVQLRHHKKERRRLEERRVRWSHERGAFVF